MTLKPTAFLDRSQAFVHAPQCAVVSYTPKDELDAGPVVRAVCLAVLALPQCHSELEQWEYGRFKGRVDDG